MDSGLSRFRTHEVLGDTKFDKLECTMGTPVEIAKKVLEWLKKEGKV